MVAYGEDHDVWEALPGWGRVHPSAICPSMLLPYAEDRLEPALWSPAHVPGHVYRAGTGRKLGTGIYWRRVGQGPVHKSVLFPDTVYSSTLEEAIARQGEYALVVDPVYDMVHYFPAERDPDKGAVLVELQVNGQVKVTRRQNPPRLRFEQWFQADPGGNP